LIELLTTLAIVGILAAVAVPGWQQQLISSRRTDATSALLRIETRQAQFLLQHSRYALNSEIGLLPPEGLGISGSFQDFYDISVAAHATGFLASAQAKAHSSQARDMQCHLFTLDATGQRAAKDRDDHDTTNRCWP